jgi:hypothetical protein
VFPRNPGHLQTFDYVGLYRYFLKRAKQFSGFYYSKHCGRRLWQRHGYERVLRSDEATLAVARYIFENPIRAGLVSRVEDYPFLGSTTYGVADILEAAGIGPAKAGHYVP